MKKKSQFTLQQRIKCRLSRVWTTQPFFFLKPPTPWRTQGLLSSQDPRRSHAYVCRCWQVTAKGRKRRTSAGDPGFPEERAGHAHRWACQDQIPSWFSDVRFVPTGNFNYISQELHMLEQRRVGGGQSPPRWGPASAFLLRIRNAGWWKQLWRRELWEDEGLFISYCPPLP